MRHQGKRKEGIWFRRVRGKVEKDREEVEVLSLRGRELQGEEMKQELKWTQNNKIKIGYYMHERTRMLIKMVGKLKWQRIMCE